MKIYNILSTIIIAYVFTSCRYEIPINLKNDPKLVVNAMINIESRSNFIYLSRTGEYDINSVYNATINIYINDILREQITEPSETDTLHYPEDSYDYYHNNKKYKTDLLFNPGDRVRIEVFADDKYHAWAEDVVPRPLEIETIDTMTFLKYDTPRIRLKTKFTDFPNEKNFYRLAVVRKIDIYIKNKEGDISYSGSFEEALQMDTSEDIVLNNGKIATNNDILPMAENYTIFNDSHLNGSYTMTTSFRRNVDFDSFPLDDESIIEYVSVNFEIHLLSITEMQYNYLKTLNIISSDSYNVFNSTPVTIPGNVEGGIGFVGFSSGTHKTFSITDMNNSFEDEFVEEKYKEEECFLSMKEYIWPPLLCVLSSTSGITGGLKYEDRIGDSYEVAYDSLVFLMKKIRPDIYLPNTVTDTVTTNHELDDRKFIYIRFSNVKNHWEGAWVLDTNGNRFDLYYKR